MSYLFIYLDGTVKVLDTILPSDQEAILDGTLSVFRCVATETEFQTHNGDGWIKVPLTDGDS